MHQISLSLEVVIEWGDSASATTAVRVVIFPGLPSQEFGVIVGFIQVYGADGFFPVMLSDLGYSKVVSYAWGLRKFSGECQLSLF